MDIPTKFCHSCGMPLANDNESNYCQYCCNSEGKLLPREAIQKGTAEFLKSRAPTTKGVDFMERADHYMKAMPAWSE